MNLSILWAKLFISLSLLAFLAARSRRWKQPSLRPLAALFVLLAARDVAYSVFPHPLLIPLSDIGVLALLLAWARVATRRWPSDIPWLGLNAAFLGFSALSILVPFISLTPFVVGLVLLADVVYLAIVLGLVSPYSAANAALVSRTRFPLISALFVAHVVSLLYGYANPFIHWVILPLMYLAYGSILLQVDRLDHELREDSIRFFSTNLDSTYDFMENLGSAITAKIDLPRVMEIIIGSAVRNIGADAGAILMVDEYQDVLRVRATYGIYPPLLPVPDIVKVKTSSLKRHFLETPIPIGDTVLGEAVTNGTPVMIRDSRGDSRLAVNSQDDILFISSLVAIPLIVGNRVLGVISALKTGGEPALHRPGLPAPQDLRGLCLHHHRQPVHVRRGSRKAPDGAGS